MTQLVAELTGEQRTALRMATRAKLLQLTDGPGGGRWVVRPLSPLDFAGQHEGGQPLRARLHTGSLAAGIWGTVARLRAFPTAAAAIWGYAAYSRMSNIDLIRFTVGGSAVTLAELPLGELIAIERRDPMRIRRRSGWIDLPILVPPGQSLDVAVISDSGIPADEPFTLLGAVAEPAGVRVMPDWANLS